MNHLSNMNYTSKGVARPTQKLIKFEQMVSDAYPKAFSLALQLTQNSVEAEDLLQETCLKAWKGYQSYVPTRPFLNWMLRIMQRAFYDRKRRDNPIRTAESLTSLASSSGKETQEISIPDEGPSQVESIIYQEFLKDVEEALKQLPEVYRHAIVLCDIDGMSYEEIAALEKTTVGTIRSRIHRGRKILRDLIQQHNIHSPYYH